MKVCVSLESIMAGGSMIPIADTLLWYCRNQKSKQAVRRLMEAVWIIHVGLGVSLQCPIEALHKHTHTHAQAHIHTHSSCCIWSYANYKCVYAHTQTQPQTHHFKLKGCDSSSCIMCVTWSTECVHCVSVRESVFVCFSVQFVWVQFCSQL